MLCLAVIYLCFLLKNSCKKHSLRSVHGIVLQTKIFQQPEASPRANGKSPVLGSLYLRPPAMTAALRGAGLPSSFLRSFRASATWGKVVDEVVFQWEVSMCR